MSTISMDCNALEKNKQRIAIFIADRVNYAMSTNDKKMLTQNAIKKLLDQEIPSF